MGAHTTAKERGAIIARYRRSSLTQREFCEAEGITLGALQSWLYRRDGARPVGPRFIEIESARLEEPAAIELHLEQLRVMLPTTLSDERIVDLAVALLQRTRGPK